MSVSDQGDAAGGLAQSYAHQLATTLYGDFEHLCVGRRHHSALIVGTYAIESFGQCLIELSERRASTQAGSIGRIEGIKSINRHRLRQCVAASVIPTYLLVKSRLHTNPEMTEAFRSARLRVEALSDIEYKTHIESENLAVKFILTNMIQRRYYLFWQKICSGIFENYSMSLRYNDQPWDWKTYSKDGTLVPVGKEIIPSIVLPNYRRMLRCVVRFMANAPLRKLCIHFAPDWVRLAMPLLCMNHYRPVRRTS